MPRFKRQGRTEFPSTEPTRVGKIDVSYVYMDLDSFETISFTIPIEQDTEEKVKEILVARVERAAKAGPEFIELETEGGLTGGPEGLEV